MLRTIATPNLDEYLPDDLQVVGDSQSAIPALAKDPRVLAIIDEAIYKVPTQHQLVCGDSRYLELEPKSDQLVVTSPPYWSFKEYRDSPGQLGRIAAYESFLK